MNVHVFDTYVKAKDGHTMHFDVITDSKDAQKAIEFAKSWLSSVVTLAESSPIEDSHDFANSIAF